MNDLVTLWMALAIGALVSGASLVAVLVAPRRLEALFAIVGVAAGAGALSATGAIATKVGRPDAAVYGVAFLMGFAGGGYALASTTLLRRTHAPAPRVDAVSDVVSSRPYVILCRCMEPESYSHTATARMLSFLVDEQLIEPTIANLPLLFFAQKARYSLAGGFSPALRGLQAITEGVRSASRELDIDVDWATCAGDERLASRVAHALGSGHRRVIVVNLAVSATVPYEQAVEEARRTADAVEGSRLDFIDAVRYDDAILRMLAARIDDAASPDEQTAVVLVAEGQPSGRTRRFSEPVERELAFVSRLRMMLTDAGRPEGSVRIAWTEWGDPDLTSELRHLAALGYRRLLVVPATRPIESLSTRADLPASVRAARLDPEVEVMIAPAWGPDTAVTGSIASSVRELLHGRPRE